MTAGENGSGPSSWRDVYQLVQDVEGRLGGLISSAETRISTVTFDHETRLRALEGDSQRGKGARILAKGALAAFGVISGAIGALGGLILAHH